ncbi:YopX family protein [Sediminibacillus massiliensis]|uniref:YopX family protein n=1 Tax=Sediminibacillus massiliensis TaxID=1926277 RepID=UPI0009885D4B|nr:YopX family protein [Sediminibacillus massiliensis]
MQEIKIQFWDAVNQKMWELDEAGETLNGWTFQYFAASDKTLRGIIHQMIDVGFGTNNSAEEEVELVARQYTGLKDIEQFEEPKELYTGDIVSMHQFLFDGDEYEDEVVGVLTYNDDQACVCLTKVNHHDIRKYMGYGNPEEFKDEKIPICMFYGLHETSWTYLGNIYEHPHLIKEATT